MYVVWLFSIDVESFVFSRMKKKDCKNVTAVSKLPLKHDYFDECATDDGIRPKHWQPKRAKCKVPLRLVRLCILGVLLPAMFVAGPVYLRYRVFSEQLFPLAISDQRLIDGKMSTIWCQRQIVKTNATFNAYLMNGMPHINKEVIPVTMMRHLLLEDDMKEYWGFYLLRGSSVTVSTCVRWPGASLTMIRGHKHLHECAFIGDDSSEELEELVEVAQERGLLQRSGDRNPNNNSSPSNEPSRMKRVLQGVQFHHQRNNTESNNPASTSQHYHPYQQQPQHHTSHELDAKDMRAILTQLFHKTLDTKKRQKDMHEGLHHHYEGVFKESGNIDKPPTFDEADFIRQELLSLKAQSSSAAAEAPRSEDVKKITEVFTDAAISHSDEMNTKITYATSTTQKPEISEKSSTITTSSSEVLENLLQQINGLGDRRKKVLTTLLQQINHENNGNEKSMEESLRKISNEEKLRIKKDVFLSSPVGGGLSNDDEDDDAAIEEGVLHPDGIADDRATVTEHTLNDRSNSEFWSSFSSSEERLLECKGLILNLPLTPHRFCDSKLEQHHLKAAVANTITYRVPVDGYYFFVFSSENEIQPNFLRIKFELLKTTYNTTESVFECKNSTTECSLPIRFFSNERTVLELPVGANDSQWNEEYIVISTCEPRTTLYLICTMAVPLLILMFAFY